MKDMTGKLRWTVQLSVLTLVSVVATLHQVMGGGFNGAPTAHALCPFGAIESFYNIVSGKSYIAKTYYSNSILAAGSVLLVFLAGKLFCGWICALGTLQDIPAFFTKKKYKVPENLDKYLRLLKYIVLVLSIYFTWKTSTLVINNFDPFSAYSHIPAGLSTVWKENPVGFSILIGILLTSFFIERAFCKYLCPLGAFYSILGRVSFFKIKREKSTCINCDKCSKVCPADIKVSKVEQVDSGKCYSCMKCVASCPTKTNSLVPTIFNKEKTAKNIIILALALFIGIIGMTKAAGVFQTMPNTMGAIVQNNPYNIRGWMTYETIIKEFKLDEKAFYEKLGFTKEELPLDTPVKKSEEAYAKKGLEFSDERVKEIVAEMINYKSTEKAEGEPKAFSFTAKMSVNEISKALNIAPKELLKKLDLPENLPLETPIRDLKSEYGIDTEKLRANIERLNISGE